MKICGIGSCTDHYTAAVPLVDDSILGLGDISSATPLHIESLGRNRGAGFWGRCDSFGSSGFIALTTDPDLAPQSWFVSYSPLLGTVVELHNNIDSAAQAHQLRVSLGRPAVLCHGAYMTVDGDEWLRTDGSVVNDAHTVRANQVPWITEIANWASRRENLKTGIVGCEAPELHPDALVGYRQIALLRRTPVSSVRSAVKRSEGTNIPQRQFTIGGRPYWSRPVIEEWHGSDNPIYDVLGQPMSNWAANDFNEDEIQTIASELAYGAAIEKIRELAAAVTSAGLNIKLNKSSFVLERDRAAPADDIAGLFAHVWLSDPRPSPVRWPDREDGGGDHN